MSQSSGKSSPFDTSGLGVLVVDDEAAVLHTVRDMLRALDIEQICTAKDGVSALEILERGEEPVNVIVADWNMPRMNGMQLFHSVRARCEKVGFLMLTGRCDPQSVLEAKTNGVDGYLRKPFSAAQLAAKLMSVRHKVETRAAAAPG